MKFKTRYIIIKTLNGRVEGGRLGWVGLGEVVVGEWRQRYLNNNENKYISNKKDFKL